MKKIYIIFGFFIFLSLASCQLDTPDCSINQHLSSGICIDDVDVVTTGTSSLIDINNPLSLNTGNDQGWTFYTNYKSTPTFLVNNGVISFTQKEKEEDAGLDTTWLRKMTYQSLSFEAGTTYEVEMLFQGTVGESVTFQIYDSNALMIANESYNLDGTLQSISFIFTPEITVVSSGILVIGVGAFQNDSSIIISNIGISAEVTMNEEINILFIGNSFTYYNNMPTILALMASSSGYLVHVEQIAYGGFELSQYVSLGSTETQEVVDKLNEREWDYVILQEQSSKPATDKTGFIQSVGQLNQLIQLNGAKTVLYSTWSYRDGTEKLMSTGYTYTDFYQALTSAYLEASNLYNTMLAPVGTVFYNLSLNETSINLLDYADDFHPTIEGSYVAAYTFYLMIFGDEKANLYRPSQLTISKTTILDQYVEEVLGVHPL